jgi:hypothetical protein
MKAPKGDEFAKIKEYQKALDSTSSSAFAASLPLGRTFFENTGIGCNNMKKTRSLFINAKPIINNETPTLGSSNASIAEIPIVDKTVSVDSISNEDAKKILDQLSQNTIYYSANNDFSKLTNDPLNESSKYDCKKQTTYTIDVNGKKKKQTAYVSTESFISLNQMNMGQKFFIGSFAVLGLLLFYKGLLKGK